MGTKVEMYLLLSVCLSVNILHVSNCTSVFVGILVHLTVMSSSVLEIYQGHI